MDKKTHDLVPFLTSNLSDANSQTKLAERYSDNPVWRALVQLIPQFGGSIDALLGGYADSIREKRRNNFLNYLASELDSVKHSLKEEFFRTEDFHDLVMKAIQIAESTRDEEKRHLAAQVIRGAALGAAIPACEELLRLIGELSRDQLALAIAIHHLAVGCTRRPDESELQWATRAGLERKSTDNSIGNFISEDIEYHISRLASIGVVREITGGYSDYSGGVYVPTPTFFRMMEALKN